QQHGHDGQQRGHRVVLEGASQSAGDAQPWRGGVGALAHGLAGVALARPAFKASAAMMSPGRTPLSSVMGPGEVAGGLVRTACSMKRPPRTTYTAVNSPRRSAAEAGTVSCDAVEAAFAGSLRSSAKRTRTFWPGRAAVSGRSSRHSTVW